MKKIFAFLGFALVCFAADAQYYYQDFKNSEMLRHGTYHQPCRTEIVLPQVNGYNVYKADLHTHTVYSDGNVLPSYRVMEAWQDGLDIMAVTEHVEYRPHESAFVEYLEQYTGRKHKEAKNNRIVNKEADKDGIMVDLNFCVRVSQKAAAKYGLTIIPGTEITRDGKKIGHFNALFTTDNNVIYDPDPLVAIRNAKAQNAIVMHNHPGWTRTSLDYTEVETVAYDEGLIDGVEVMNGIEFYPGIIDRVRERNLFIAANTDIHATTASEYRNNGATRPMTLILAKDKSLESVREALEAGRTLAFGFNTLCGEEQLLKDFFVAGMKTEVISTDKDGRSVVMVTNLTSVPYLIKIGNGNPIYLDPFKTVSLTSGKGSGTLKFTVLNMFCSADAHPVVELSF